MANAFKACSVDGCNGNARYTELGRKGFCCAHYKRFRRHGAPLGGATSPGDLLKFIKEIALKYQGSDCLIWPYSKGGAGYGHLSVDGKDITASRYVCELAHGAPPTPEHEAAHSCGNGHLGCVTKGHLSWKTSKENKADMLIHGTHNRGDRHYGAKFTEAQVLEIRRLKGIKSQRAIAAEYGVTRGAIDGVHRGKTWGWLIS